MTGEERNAVLSQVRRELDGVLQIHLSEMAEKLLKVTEALVAADTDLADRLDRLERWTVGPNNVEDWDEEPSATQPYEHEPGAFIPIDAPNPFRWPWSRAR